MKRPSLWVICLLCLSGCSPLASIPYSPPQTPESWLRIQPYTVVRVGSNAIIVVQPSTTVFVYLLGLIAIGAGLHFWRMREQHQSRLWWGAALALWGLGALSAGTSYEAFSYTIKCAGRALCAWTSWWEIAYLLLSVASVDAMLVAGAYACATGKVRKALIAYAAANLTLYILVVLVGAFSLTKFLISFELLLVVAAPTILILFGLNGWRYLQFRGSLDQALLITWVWLGLTLGAYFLYLVSGLTQTLWAKGLWFSENDVLHWGLIGWMVFIAAKVAPRVVDALDN